MQRDSLSNAISVTSLEAVGHLEYALDCFLHFRGSIPDGINRTLETDPNLALARAFKAYIGVLASARVRTPASGRLYQLTSTVQHAIARDPHLEMTETSSAQLGTTLANTSPQTRNDRSPQPRRLAVDDAHLLQVPSLTQRGATMWDLEDDGMQRTSHSTRVRFRG
jgi:hypothetical protein